MVDAPPRDGTITVAFAAAGDTNLDGQIDILDISTILGAASFDAAATGGWAAGDFNHDGRMNLADFNVLASNFGMSGGATFAQGDANYDGNVNLADFNILAGRFGAVVTPPAQFRSSFAAAGDDEPLDLILSRDHHTTHPTEDLV